MACIVTEVDPNLSFKNATGGLDIEDGATVTMAELVHGEFISMDTVRTYGPEIEERVQQRLDGVMPVNQVA